MDIDRVGPRQNDPAISGQYATRRTDRVANDGQSAADPNQVGSSSTGDTVEISAESRTLSRARQAVDSAPDVRADKVAEIKKRIEDGTYSVSPEALANKLLGGSGESA
jgi:negative regulator of flagellin synthesis FlgM